ncbi:MAG: glycoside hydrolase family 2 [Marivirga sp.]|nr:glycoside hydrolase family 2 [Marivirga sp.]
MRKKNAGFIILMFLASASGLAQERHHYRLINEWEFLKGDLGGIWEAVRPTGSGAPEGVPEWKKIQLPHCYNARDAVDPEVNYYQGPGWYRTWLSIENPYDLGRTLLQFEGAGQKTEVYVYTTNVGIHVGGYDEWTVDITDAVAEFKKTEAYLKFDKKVPLAIRCDNSRDLQMIPSSLSDFNLYGGIYRYLNLVYVPLVSIDRILATPKVAGDGKATIGIETAFHNPGKKTDAVIKISVHDPSGKVIDNTSSVVTINEQVFEWTATLRRAVLWSPSDPQLYTIHVSVTSPSGVHTRREKIGFREFTFEKQGPFMLNSKRLLLKGTHRHEDHAGIGSAMTEGMMRKEMIMMKEMGVNFIRLGHYQQSRIILNLCDSLGILVWEEIPWCRGGLGNVTYQQQARNMLTNMIHQHYNHPSVIIWGLGNENDWPGDFPEFDKEKIRTFMKELNDLSHTLDPSRKTAIRRCEFCKHIVDVYSPSIWAGWYRGRYTEYKQVTEKEFKSVDHFLHVEWGGDSHAGRHAEEPGAISNRIYAGNGADERGGDASLIGGSFRFSKDGDWSETYVCNLIDWHLKEQETMPWLTGTAYWPFKDFSTPARPENPVPYVNQKGVVERDFTPKSAYYVFQSYWTEKPMIHIYGHTWPVRWGDSNEPKTVKVYSNCSEVELFVNGISHGTKKRNSQDFPAAGLRWPVKLNEGNNVIRAVGRKGIDVVEDQISQQYQTAKWTNPSKLLVERVNEEADIVTIQAKILDGANVLCLDADNWIHFSIAGDGQLVDDLGTSSGSRKVQAYNGRAVIKLRTNNGRNVICVKSPSLPTVFLSLDRQPDAP